MSGGSSNRTGGDTRGANFALVSYLSDVSVSADDADFIVGDLVRLRSNKDYIGILLHKYDDMWCEVLWTNDKSRRETVYGLLLIQRCEKQVKSVVFDQYEP